MINNEFFDALPTKKFIFKNGMWCEVMVGIDEEKFAEKNQIELKIVYSQPNNISVQKLLQPDKTFKENGIECKEGDTYEFSIERKLFHNNFLIIRGKKYV